MADSPLHANRALWDAWTALHKTVLVPFDLPGDDARAFCNVNTLDELRQLENVRA